MTNKIKTHDSKTGASTIAYIEKADMDGFTGGNIDGIIRSRAIAGAVITISTEFMQKSVVEPQSLGKNKIGASRTTGVRITPINPPLSQ